MIDIWKVNIFFIYICIYIHVYMCICVYILYIHIHVYMCIYNVYIHIHTYIHIYVCVCVYIYIYIMGWPKSLFLLFCKIAQVMLGFSRWHSGKELTCQCGRQRKCGFNSWPRKISWNRKWLLTPVLLPGESHLKEKPGWLLYKAL